MSLSSNTSERANDRASRGARSSTTVGPSCCDAPYRLVNSHVVTNNMEECKGIAMSTFIEVGGTLWRGHVLSNTVYVLVADSYCKLL
jgi:hypothetical protein